MQGKKIFMTYKKPIPERVGNRWKGLNPEYEIDFSLDNDCIRAFTYLKLIYSTILFSLPEPLLAYDN